MKAANAERDDPSFALPKTLKRLWRRRHASTSVVLLAAAAVLFLLNVPGQYVPHVGISREVQQSNVLNVFDRLVYERMEHGWPFTYLVRDDKGSDPQFGGLGYKTNAGVWSLTQYILSFELILLLGNLAVALCVLALVAVLWERWRRQRKNLWQFGVRGLLVMTTIVAIGVWYALTTLREYNDELNALRKLGLRVDEDWPIERQYGIDPSVRSRGGPTWLRGTIGEEIFPRVFDRLVYAEPRMEGIGELRTLKRLKAVSVVIDPRKSTLIQLSNLKNLEAIDIGGISSVFSEAGHSVDPEELDKALADKLASLVQLPNLWLFRAAGNGVGDRSARVIATFPHLRALHLSRSAITEGGLAAIAQCETLEELTLQDHALIDSSLNHLERLPNLHTLDLERSWLSRVPFEEIGKIQTLRQLDLDGTVINYTVLNDRDLRCLASLPALESLSLPDNVSRAAVAELQRQLPNLKITIGGEEFSEE